MIAYVNMIGLLLCVVGGFMIHPGLGFLIIGVIAAIQQE
jgi:hypothetical protein